MYVRNTLLTTFRIAEKCGTETPRKNNIVTDNIKISQDARDQTVIAERLQSELCSKREVRALMFSSLDNISHPSVYEERCISTLRKGWQSPQVSEDEVDLPGGNPGGLPWSACILTATAGQIKPQRNTPVIPWGTAEYVWKSKERKERDVSESCASEAFISLWFS